MFEFDSVGESLVRCLVRPGDAGKLQKGSRPRRFVCDITYSTKSRTYFTDRFTASLCLCTLEQSTRCLYIHTYRGEGVVE